MNNADRIVDALRRHGPLSDAHLVTITDVRPHQQVNQICRRLEAQGVLRRLRSPSGAIHNVLVGDSRPDEQPMVQPARPATRPTEPSARTQSGATGANLRAADSETLLILPCSGGKRRGGSRQLDGSTILDLLPGRLADRLITARRALHQVAEVDESHLLPARRRYSGTLYQAAGTSLEQTGSASVRLLIVSGGYGLVLGDEPIGHYNRMFHRSDWPAALLRDCLEAAVPALAVSRVVALCAQTTAYAHLVRATRWKQMGIKTALISPLVGGGEGAQVLVPRALGEAAGELLGNGLRPGWRSSDGVGLRTEALS